MMSILPVLFVAAPLAIYIVVAMRRAKTALSPDEFFEARNVISPSDFANSSVAYGFQIASVSIFFAWGYLFGLGAIVNPLFWGFGIVFFMLFSGRLSDFFGSTQTLPGFLGKRYGSRWITIIASMMTMIGYLGAFTAELVWGSWVLSIISPDPLFIGISVTVMAAIVALYVTRAGFVSVVKTDQYQLIFAHSSFVVLVVFLITLLHWQDQEAGAVGFFLSVVSAVLLGLVALSIVRQVRYKGDTEWDTGRVIATVILCIVSGGAVFSVVNAIIFAGSLEAASTALADGRLYDFRQGTLNLASLALLPLCWQFADVTMWQRLGAVRLPPEGTPDRFVPIRRGLLRYAIESPVTWILAIIAGIALRYADLGVTEETVWNGLAEIPLSILAAETAAGTIIQWLVASLFAAGIVAAMLSTADSFLMGSTFTFSYDIVPQASHVDATTTSAVTHQALRFGRIAVVSFIVLALGSYWIASALDFDILAILFGAFAAQVSLFPAVFGTVLLRHRAPSGGWALASVVVGFIAAAVALIVALNDETWALYPPLFALGGSIPVYVSGIFLSYRDMSLE